MKRLLSCFWNVSTQFSFLWLLCSVFFLIVYLSYVHYSEIGQTMLRQKGNIHRINTVSDTSAQIAIPCAKLSVANKKFELKVLSFINDIKQDIQLRAIVSFQLFSACRISEVLQLTPADFLSASHVLLRSLKHSENRVVSYNDNTGFIARRIAAGTSLIFEYNRFYVYRQYRALGFVLRPSKSSKLAITHSIRHFVARTVSDTLFDMELTRHLLRQKSKRSTSYYINRPILNTNGKT